MKYKLYFSFANMLKYVRLSNKISDQVCVTEAFKY